jgi:hypothetical protein
VVDAIRSNEKGDACKESSSRGGIAKTNKAVEVVDVIKCIYVYGPYPQSIPNPVARTTRNRKGRKSNNGDIKKKRKYAMARGTDASSKDVLCCGGISVSPFRAFL